MDKKKQVINKKLLIICGVLLIGGCVYTFFPTSKVEKTTATNTSTNNNVVSVATPNQIKVPKSEEISIDNVNNHVAESYQRSESEIESAKDAGVYQTYSSASSANPLYQKYAYSKESGSSNKSLDNYPNSFNGSITSSKDYAAKFTDEAPTTNTSKTSANNTSATDSSKSTTDTNSDSTNTKTGNNASNTSSTSNTNGQTTNNTTSTSSSNSGSNTNKQNAKIN